MTCSEDVLNLKKKQQFCDTLINDIISYLYYYYYYSNAIFNNTIQRLKAGP